MSEVFLSYKREDLKAATRLVDVLRGSGLNVWWDRDIPAGEPWEATIERSLAEAGVVLVCWSKAAVGASYKWRAMSSRRAAATETAVSARAVSA